MEIMTEKNVEDCSLGLRSVCPSIIGWSLVIHHHLFLSQSQKTRNHVRLSSSCFPSTVHSSPSSLGMGPLAPLHPPLPISVLPTSNLWKMVGSHGPEGRRGAKKSRQALPLSSKNDPLCPFPPSSQEHSRIQEWEESDVNPPHSGTPALTFCSLGSGMTRVRAA